jgi:hypothetical protein
MVLALKLFMTPCLIATASLAGRRWGPGVSGWLIGLPLTSGPVSLILASQYGRPFAAQAAVGTLAGQGSVCIFCLTYSLLSQKWGWAASAVLSSLAFFIATLIWDSFSLSLLPTLIALLVIIRLVIYWIPRRDAMLNVGSLPKWDLPARMIVATTFVIVLTTIASFLGPQLSGLISPFPVFGMVLTAFAHSQHGPNAAMRLLRGMAIGAFAFASFFLIVGGLLTSLGILWTYILAAVAAVSVNGISLRLVR